MALLIGDPLDVAMDADGDILIDANGLSFVRGLEGVAQLCRIAIRLYLEEWFANLDRGMPWYQEILGEKFDEVLARRRLSEVLLAVPGVLSIKSLVITFSIDTITVTSEVTTEFGDTKPDTLALAGGS